MDETTSHQLFIEYDLKYNIYQICKCHISNNQIIGITSHIMAHIECINNKGLLYEFRGDLINKILISMVQ